MVPTRAAPLFAPTLKLTLPSPLPDAGAISAIHAVLEADHAQPECAMTFTLPDPPPTPIELPCDDNA